MQQLELEILDSKYLFDFFKFRTSNHKLSIECGRLQNIERNRRLWILCQKQKIGDEFHYIMGCPLFKCKRKLSIKQKYLQNPCIIKLNNLMTSKNRKNLLSCVNQLKRYIKVCVQARISYLICKYCFMTVLLYALLQLAMVYENKDE